MRNSQVTPVTAPEVVPSVYADLDVTISEGGADEAVFLDGLRRFPSLQAVLLTKRGPAGWPEYRVEGPLPQLIGWLSQEYGAEADDVLEILKSARLAR